MSFEGRTGFGIYLKISEIIQDFLDFFQGNVTGFFRVMHPSIANVSFDFVWYQLHPRDTSHLTFNAPWSGHHLFFH